MTALCLSTAILAGPGEIFCPSFNPDMTEERLANTTISALSLREIFDNVNGTQSRTFSIYHSHNKLVFFPPYGLSLALTIFLALVSFIALYIRNRGISAINGSLLQLLMTTIGRTSLDAMLAKGPGTMCGYENASAELGK
ncbi:hypothetical protein ST47_g482 [Ascochyta rabiei]|uniref:Uncharacterized protein n=1 Tax=Didymella rabiei TaxID=5454 RepID=A0A163M3H2_DIDRA|nr:hypothetical protein ST47_g482 [Ascochyta rabiei]